MASTAAFVLEDDVGMVLLLRALLEETHGWTVHFGCGKYKVDVDSCAGRRGRSPGCAHKCEDEVLDSCGLALIDVDVSCGTGLRTIRDLRARRPELPVIAITAHASSAKKALAKGATSCVSRPFVVTDLLDALEDASDVVDLRSLDPQRQVVAQDA
jgi:CheY-like chemotaxis protein